MSFIDKGKVFICIDYLIPTFVLYILMLIFLLKEFIDMFVHSKAQHDSREGHT